MKDKDTSIDKLNCYAIHIGWVFLSFDNQASNHYTNCTYFNRFCSHGNTHLGKPL